MMTSNTHQLRETTESRPTPQGMIEPSRVSLLRELLSKHIEPKQ